MFDVKTPNFFMTLRRSKTGFTKPPQLLAVAGHFVCSWNDVITIFAQGTPKAMKVPAKSALWTMCSSI
jgi:hypothetical protein